MLGSGVEDVYVHWGKRGGGLQDYMNFSNPKVTNNKDCLANKYS